MKNNESMNYKLFDMSAMTDAMLESTSIDFYQYINTMTEEQMDNSIANADEIYEYIINDETYMIQLENEDNESDTDDEIANSEYEKFEYYDEENVSEVIVDFDPNVEKNVEKNEKKFCINRLVRILIIATWWKAKTNLKKLKNLIN
jgi:hypothetical protein